MKYILGFLLMVFIMSCNSVRKMSSSTSVKEDSTSLRYKDSLGVKKVDSSTFHSDAGTYEKETVYQYDTVYRVQQGDTVIQYVPRIIRVFEKGAYTKVESATHSNYDSGKTRQVDSTVASSESKTVIKQKQTHRFPTALVIGGVVVIIVGTAGYILYKKKLV